MKFLMFLSLLFGGVLLSQKVMAEIVPREPSIDSKDRSCPGFLSTEGARINNASVVFQAKSLKGPSSSALGRKWFSTEMRVLKIMKNTDDLKASFNRELLSKGQRVTVEQKIGALAQRLEEDKEYWVYAQYQPNEEGFVLATDRCMGTRPDGRDEFSPMKRQEFKEYRGVWGTR